MYSGRVEFSEDVAQVRRTASIKARVRPGLKAALVEYCKATGFSESEAIELFVTEALIKRGKYNTGETQ